MSENKPPSTSMSDPKDYADLLGCTMVVLDDMRVENARLKEEVDSLQHQVNYWRIEAQTDHARWLRVLEDHDRLKEKSACQAECLDAFEKKLREAKAEVERLRKAGDDMASSIQFNEEMEKDYDGPTIVHPSVERWNAAKEGKQS